MSCFSRGFRVGAQRGIGHAGGKGVTLATASGGLETAVGAKLQKRRMVFPKTAPLCLGDWSATAPSSGHLGWHLGRSVLPSVKNLESRAPASRNFCRLVASASVRVQGLIRPLHATGCFPSCPQQSSGFGWPPAYRVIGRSETTESQHLTCAKELDCVGGRRHGDRR